MVSTQLCFCFLLTLILLDNLKMALKHRLSIRPLKATKDVATTTSNNHEDFQLRFIGCCACFFPESHSAKRQEETENRGVELDARLYNAESQVDSNLSEIFVTWGCSMPGTVIFQAIVNRSVPLTIFGLFGYGSKSQSRWSQLVCPKCLPLHAFNHRMLASNIRYVPVYIYIYYYGGFLKWGYPQIIHFNRMFSYKL